MPQLLGVRIQNYRSLVDLTLGQVRFNEGEVLPPLICFIGPNGCGKSSLLDAFAFIGDCLREGVEEACDKPHRGGFANLLTRGKTESIQFDLYYRENAASRPITYHFAINSDGGVPIIAEEKLQQRRKGQKTGRPYPFLDITNGQGDVWAGQSSNKDEGTRKDRISLEDNSKLAITTLGQFTEHERIVGLRKYLENWYLSYFVPDLARKLPPAGAQKHLDRTGENLGNYVQFLERNHGDRFKKILERVSKRIPGIRSISTVRSDDNRLLLQFNEQGYVDPFYQQSMSDGTLKLFAYQLLLEDPEPHSLIGIEEPENGLYHKLHDQLAREFLANAAQSRGKIQALITTHSPYFVDALKPENVWMLNKNTRGETVARNTASIPIVQELLKEHIPLGSVWYSEHFDESEEP
jgi:predicted ATPase